jgi:carbonic anhydrase/acetyltransferase-like protein (isoleucine patch superfamily)
MIPGLSTATEARILAALTGAVTSIRPESYAAGDYVLLTGRDAESHALGVQVAAGPELTLVVTDAARPIGNVRIETSGSGNLVFIDNRAWRGMLNANIRMLGSEAAVIFNDIGADGYVALPDVFLRSDQQFLFWGSGASAVGCSVEIEGVGQGLVVGDDALISNGVWIRNYNMHALHDLGTGARIGRPPVTTVIERHVWLGQDALLLSCERIGTGSVIGARAFVNAAIPPRVVAAGTPARVIRQGVSWGRDTYDMTQAERLAVGAGESVTR